MIINIIQNLPMHKKSKEVFALLVRALSEVRKPVIRTLVKKFISNKLIDPNRYSSPQSLVDG